MDDPRPPRRVARDGSQRGLNKNPSKTRTSKLLVQMQKEVKKQCDKENFDPVVGLAIIGARLMDERWVTDSVSGQRRLIPADYELAIAALKSAAPYVHAQIRAVEISGPDGGPVQHETVGAKEKLGQLLDANPTTEDASFAETPNDEEPSESPEAPEAIENKVPTNPALPAPNPEAVRKIDADYEVPFDSNDNSVPFDSGDNEEEPEKVAAILHRPPKTASNLTRG